MANIQKRINKDGSTSYRVQIRKSNLDIQKTFSDEKDAKLYVFYKEKLIENMNNFEVPIKERLTLNDLFEMKINSYKGTDKKAISDFSTSVRKFSEIFKDKFYNEISFQEWIDAAKNLLNSDVYRGGKNENCKRKMSPLTLRRYFACASSAISHAQSNGLEIDNMPIKVMQTFINPMLKREEK